MVLLLVLWLLLAQATAALTLPTASAATWPHGYVAMCLCAKDQHPEDIKEWVRYHRYLGAGKAYVYDNGSQKPLAFALAPYIREGYVKYTWFTKRTPAWKNKKHPGFHTTPQAWAYFDCIKRYGHLHRWLAFIDADEFIVLHDTTQSLPEFLQPYEQYGGVALNWIMFGSSGHETQPEGGVLTSYTKCLKLGSRVHQHVKVIGNTKYVIGPSGDPHGVRLNGSHVVNEFERKVVGPFSDPPSHKRAAVYHYVNKSWQEFETKMARGSGDGRGKGKPFFTSIDQQSTETCLGALPAAKAAAQATAPLETGSAYHLVLRSDQEAM